MTLILKLYLSEEQVRTVYNSLKLETVSCFEGWLDNKMEEGEIELIEFNYYAVSALLINEYLEVV